MIQQPDKDRPIYSQQTLTGQPDLNLDQKLQLCRPLPCTTLRQYTDARVESTYNRRQPAKGGDML